MDVATAPTVEEALALTKDQWIKKISKEDQDLIDIVNNAMENGCNHFTGNQMTQLIGGIIDRYKEAVDENSTLSESHKKKQQQKCYCSFYRIKMRMFGFCQKGNFKIPFQKMLQNPLVIDC